jgi:hypothetical protein
MGVKMQVNPKITSIAERLINYPDFVDKVDALLNIMENTDGSCIKANDAERRVIAEVQKIGQNTLTQWAQNRESVETINVLQKGKGIKHGKKNYIGIQNTEK